MLESLLKPISVAYCGNEYTRDSSHYLQSLIAWKQQATSNAIDHNKIHLIAADVQSLYPSCSRDLVKRALQQALLQSTFSEEVQRLIIDAAMYCMEHVILQFDCGRPDWVCYQRLCEAHSCGKSLLEWFLLPPYQHVQEHLERRMSSDASTQRK